MKTVKKIAELGKAFKDGKITQEELDKALNDLLGFELKEEDEELAAEWERGYRGKSS